MSFIVLAACKECNIWLYLRLKYIKIETLPDRFMTAGAPNSQYTYFLIANLSEKVVSSIFVVEENISKISIAFSLLPVELNKLNKITMLWDLFWTMQDFELFEQPVTFNSFDISERHIG